MRTGTGIPDYQKSVGTLQIIIKMSSLVEYVDVDLFSKYQRYTRCKALLLHVFTFRGIRALLSTYEF